MFKLSNYLLSIQLVWVMHHVPQQHLPEKVSRLLCWMALHENVQVTERGTAVANTRIRICDI